MSSTCSPNEPEKYNHAGAQCNSQARRDERSATDQRQRRLGQCKRLRRERDARVGSICDVELRNAPEPFRRDQAKFESRQAGAQATVRTATESPVPVHVHGWIEALGFQVLLSDPITSPAGPLGRTGV